MKKSKYTQEFKDRVIAYDKIHGFLETIKVFGISKSTLYDWKNPGYFVKSQKNRYNNEKKSRLENAKQYYLENKEVVKERVKKYRDAHKIERREYMREYLRNKYKTDINYRLTKNLRRRVILGLNGAVKSDRTLKLIGCSIPVLKFHLESLWTVGMNWDNYGEWHIDHIKPCSSFDLTDPEQQKECFHYTNLQPLWATDNLTKSDNIVNN